MPSSLLERIAHHIDRRIAVSQAAHHAANKIFPHHWSFLLGELALFSFLLLVLTGLFLTMFYRPAVDPVMYAGASPYYDGVELPAAYASIVALSHDVPVGDLFRRVHRFSAHVFVASTILHGVRVFLTGAFRKPRELNYALGLVLLLLAIGSAFTGQILPYDVIAGFTLRVTDAFLLSVPWVGPHLSFWVFGGEYLTADVLHRMYILHVLILPAVIGLLVGAHLVLVVRQKHTQFADPRVDGQRVVVGRPLWPWQFVISTSLGLIMLVVILVAATVVPWSDVALNGPYVVGHSSNAAQPDWWLMWSEGALRLIPAIQIDLLGTVVSQVFLGGIVLPVVLFGGLFLYPYVERRRYPVEAPQHVLQHPFDVPLRLGLFTTVAVALLLLTGAAMLDYVARLLRRDLEGVFWFFRIATLILPPSSGLLAAAYADRRGRSGSAD